ncbi:ras-related and estrogen-regulated growth inhibitor-like [Asterias amurensis]|uniref:ras-related and estrogen-regulated growth inhibitor-like n=1 Tax=Asterias amurensis TaxID=7602 RepID=UPI0021E9DBC1
MATGIRRSPLIFQQDVKFTVLGKPGVGKSALVVRYLTHRFIGDYDQNLESMYTQSAKIDDQLININLVDTAGEFDCESATRQELIRSSDGLVLVFSLVDRESFNYLQNIKSILVKTPGRDAEKIPAIIVANKSDLCHLRTVASTEGAELAKELGCPYYELSASEGYIDIGDALHDLCREIYRAEKRAKVKKISARLQLRQTIKNFTDRHIYRSRTNTL